MPAVTIYNYDGQAVGTRELPLAVFGQPVKPAVLHAAVVAQSANRRPVVAHTKTRGEVRGGGRKPWRQKGTGRARHGSIRSPLWIGGGVVFGPRSERNFAKKINQRVRRQALVSSLSAKVAESALMVVDDLSRVDGKTKHAARLLTNLKLRPAKRVAQATPADPSRAVNPATVPGQPRTKPPSVLVVLPPVAKPLQAAFRNLPRVSVLSTDSMNVADVVGHQYVLTPLSGVDRLAAVLGPKRQPA